LLQLSLIYNKIQLHNKYISRGNKRNTSMPKVPTSIFDFSYPRDHQDTPSAMPKTTSTSSLFDFLPYRRSNPENPSQNATVSPDKPIANAFASATQRYVPRPFRHEAQHPAILVHPLARQWPVASAGLPAPNAEASQSLAIAPAIPFQIAAQPVSDAAIEQDQAQGAPSQIVAPQNSDAPMEQDQNSAQDIHTQIIAEPAEIEQDRAPNTHSQIVASPVSNAPMEQDQNSVQDIHTQIIAEPAAIEQDQAPNTHSQIVASPVSNAPMEQDQNSAQDIVFSNTATQNLRKMKFLSKRRYDNGRIITGRAVTEKTRLVEQLDLTTRKIMDHKDSTISELQAQV
jgi:hypothetical protein